MTAGLPSIFATTSVVVRKPVETVWRIFNDRSKWMDSFKSLEVVQGVIGETGAIARVVMTADGPGVQRLEETLHAESFRRQVIRLTTAGPAAHADFQFEPTPEGCRVTVSIHGFLLASAGCGTFGCSFRRLCTRARRHQTGRLFYPSLFYPSLC